MIRQPITEHAITFHCEGLTLVGVLAKPERARQLAVAIVVGGPQYRVGSHRHFVQLARHLAASGFTALRFDVRGMGDSEGEPRGFDQLDADIHAAIDALQSRTDMGTRVVLLGLCDGASAALMYLQRHHDQRVVGVCLLNPWTRSPESQARTLVKHYYLQRLLQPGFWRKLLKGGVGVRSVSELAHSMTTAFRSRAGASFQDRMLEGLRGFGGQTLLILSSNDYTAKEFGEFTRADPRWRALLQGARVRRHEVAGADHTFSQPAMGAQVAALTVEWLGSAF